MKMRLACFVIHSVILTRGFYDFKLNANTHTNAYIHVRQVLLCFYFSYFAFSLSKYFFSFYQITDSFAFEMFAYYKTYSCTCQYNIIL